MHNIKGGASKNNLKNQDGRNADAKTQVFCLMAKEEHTKKTSDASAQNCSEEKGALTDAPFLLYRPAFVHTESDKTGEIYDNQIDQNSV